MLETALRKRLALHTAMVVWEKLRDCWDKPVRQQPKRFLDTVRAAAQASRSAAIASGPRKVVMLAPKAMLCAAFSSALPALRSSGASSPGAARWLCVCRCRCPDRRPATTLAPTAPRGPASGWPALWLAVYLAGWSYLGAAQPGGGALRYLGLGS